MSHPELSSNHPLRIDTKSMMSDGTPICQIGSDPTTAANATSNPWAFVLSGELLTSHFSGPYTVLARNMLPVSWQPIN
jgi:hypothetical protein